jgi:hypothetical protein
MTCQSQLNNVDPSIDEINPFQEEIDANDADDSILPTIPSMLGSTRDSLAGNDLRDFRLVYDQDQQQLVLDQQQLDSNLQLVQDQQQQDSNLQQQSLHSRIMLQDGYQRAEIMLNSIDMIRSPSQYQDDLRKFAKDHKELRAKIISMLDFFVNYAPNRMAICLYVNRGLGY